MKNAYMPVNLNRQRSAKAMGKDLPISPKVAIEICNFIRHRELENAIAILKRVQEKKQAIPYKRFPNAAGHKPGMAAGRYPIKVAGEFLELLENAKANASNQGLSGKLTIMHIAAQRANEPFRNRAKERITFKRAHLEVVLVEDKTEKKEKVPRQKKETKHETKIEAKVES